MKSLFKRIVLLTSTLLIMNCGGGGGGGGGTGTTNKTQVSLSEVKKFEEATATPGTCISFRMSGTINDGSSVSGLAGTLTSSINHPVESNGQMFNIKEDIIDITDASTGQIISGTTTSYITSTGSLSSVSDGYVNGTVISQKLLPATAAVGDSDNYATVNYDDGTTDKVTWLIRAASNDDVIIQFTYITTDNLGNKLYIEDDSYTIKPDGTISGLNVRVSDLEAGVTMNLSGTRMYSLMGKITSSNGSGVSGVTISILQGTTTQTAKTNYHGEYVISVAQGGTYTITPSCPITTTFTPSIITSSMNNADVAELNFVINDSTLPLTKDASKVTDTSAWLNGSFSNSFGTVTTVYFEYGKTTSYGKTTNPLIYFDPIEFFAITAAPDISQLTTYHYRVVTSTAGLTFYGTDKTFTSLMSPQVIVSGLEYPLTLAIDGSNIYWTEHLALKKIGKAGGAITTLASGVNTAYEIAVDSTSVYWAEYYGNMVNKVDVNSGVITTLASSVGNVGAIAISDTNVYWPYLGIMTVGKNGGVPTTIVPGAHPVDVAFSNNSIYWLDNIGMAINKCGVSGDLVTTLVPNDDFARAIIVDSSGVYWSGTGGIKRYNESDGTITILDPEGGAGLALDSTSVYYISYADSVTELRKVGKNGGSVTTLANLRETNNQYGISVDDINVYWIEQNIGVPNGGLIKSLPKNYK